MKTRIILATGTLATLLSAPAFAEDGVATGAAAPRLSAQAQIELLPSGSASASVGSNTISTDTAVAYGVSGMLDYAVTPNISIGVAPRLVLNVKASDAADRDGSGKQIDLRARVLAHFPVAPGVQLYASVAPGYTIVTSPDDGTDSTKGFSIGGAGGVSYDLSPRMFVAGEVGYQRAFSSSDMTLAGQTITVDSSLSYLHIGLGAGTRF
jgi:opacity protein-like surface antigen